MKKFILGLFFIPSLVFGAGDMSKQPSSIQRVNNTTLTCPTGKWCRVIATYYIGVGAGNAGGQGGGYFSSDSSSGNFEVILKSGQQISATVTAPAQSGCFSARGIQGTNNIVFSVGGTTINRFYGYFFAFCVAQPGQTITFDNISSYSFQSFEYYN